MICFSFVISGCSSCRITRVVRLAHCIIAEERKAGRSAAEVAGGKPQALETWVSSCTGDGMHEGDLGSVLRRAEAQRSQDEVSPRLNAVGEMPDISSRCGGVSIRELARPCPITLPHNSQLTTHNSQLTPPSAPVPSARLRRLRGA